MPGLSIEQDCPIPTLTQPELLELIPLHELELGSSILIRATNRQDRRKLRALIGRLADYHSRETGRGYVAMSVGHPYGVRVWLHSVPAAVSTPVRNVR